MPDKRLLAIYLAGFVGPLGGNAVLAMLPALEQEFSVGTTEVLLSLPFFMFPFAIIQFFSGTLSDLYDRRLLVAGGFAIYGAASLLCTVALDLPTFLAARLLQGVGFAFVSPVLLAMLGDYTSRSGRGLAMGFFGSSITAGTAVGPLIGGVAADIDWRLAFYLFAALAGVLAVLFSRSFERTAGRRGDRRERERLNRWNVGLLSAAGFLAFFAFAGAISFTAAVLPTEQYAFSPLDVGVVLAMAGVAGIFASPAGGALVDRAGRFRTGLAGLAVTALAIMLLGAARGVWQFGLVMLLLGSGTALVWASLNTITVELTPERKGTVSSLFNAFRFLGFAAAVPLLTPLFDTGGVGMVYAVAVAASVASAVSLGLLARSVRPSPSIW
jgi:MFS family permease